jgi:hypothetical protein
MRVQLAIFMSWLVCAAAWAVMAPGAYNGERLLAFSGGDQMALGDLEMGQELVRFPVVCTAAVPVHVKKVSASCACMDLEFPYGRLLPGQERLCEVAIRVEPGKRKTVAVIFDIEKPYRQRIVKMLSYRGLQRDKLTVEVRPALVEMPPGSLRTVAVCASWSGRSAIKPMEAIKLRLEKPRGVRLVGFTETLRRDREVRCQFNLEFDTRVVDSLSADIHLLAGQPPRAEYSARISCRVASSVELRPRSLVPAPAQWKVGDLLGKVSLIPAKGWRVVVVQAPDWLRVVRGDDSVEVFLRSLPSSLRVVGSIKVLAVGPGEARVERFIKCVVEME